MKIEIQCDGMAANKDLRDFARRRVYYALSSRKEQIDAVRLRLAEVGEARDQKNLSCRVQVCLSNLYKVNAEVMDSDIRVAIHRAVDRAGWTAARRLQRERLKAGSILVTEHHLSDNREPDRAA